MGQIIDISQLKRSKNEDICVDENIESEFIGMVKYLFLEQMINSYGKIQLVNLMYNYLDSEHRSMLENYLEENPCLKIKYTFNVHNRNIEKSAK